MLLLLTTDTKHYFNYSKFSIKTNLFKCNFLLGCSQLIFNLICSGLSEIIFWDIELVDIYSFIGLLDNIYRASMRLLRISTMISRKQLFSSNTKQIQRAYTRSYMAFSNQIKNLYRIFLKSR